MAISEFRLYGFILNSLADMGWDKRPPHRGGQVYTQNEVFNDSFLKAALHLRRPENIVVIEGNPKRYWVIEAKADIGDMDKALKDAKTAAKLINNLETGKCCLITGVAGDTDSAHMVETHVLVSGEWRPLTINGRPSTGFISPEQVNSLLDANSATLDDYDICDDLFIEKTNHINKILHAGGVNKRNRAAVLASLLLAVAQDQQIRLNEKPKIMIEDINNRAKALLESYGKSNFFGEIQIHLPTSDDNHVKHKKALVDTIDVLRGLNIASAINSGRDVLGQFYEQFLKYANDAKELGIVLTPRHITSFAAKVVDVQKNNVVFDPACGTGGFLVAALDKVRQDIGDIDEFKRGNLHGIEQDPLIAALAIVNMIFRGDGSSNILEGDGLKTDPKCKPDRCLLNPPFALDAEFEWMFVERALTVMETGGLLFGVLPTSTMMSAQDSRKEITWRTSMLKEHRLLAVVKLPEDLFYPHVSKGTCGVLIRAHVPHKVDSDKVFWAVMDDGHQRTKTGQSSEGNIKEIEKALCRFVINANDEPAFVPQQMDCTVIRQNANNILDLSPENHIGRDAEEGVFDLSFLSSQMRAAHLRLSKPSGAGAASETGCRPFFLREFIELFEKGKSGRSKDLRPGTLPLISTSETENGISALVDSKSVNQVYPPGTITVSSNGGSCCAFFHDYDFAANPDVFVLALRERYNSREFSLFLCAAINNESWRYNYFRKFNQTQLKSLTVQIPVDSDGDIDFTRIERLVIEAGLLDSMYESTDS